MRGFGKEPCLLAGKTARRPPPSHPPPHGGGDCICSLRSKLPGTLVLRSFTFILALFAVPAAAETETSSFRLDDTRLLRPAQNGTWDLVDTSSGKIQTLRLPAFNEELSAATLQGNRLAYTSLIRRGERLQLGCISIDLTKGKVADREDTRLLLAEDSATPLQAPSFSGDGLRVDCHLSGEKCDKGNPADCTQTEETVTLSSLSGKSARAVPKSLRGKPSARKPSKRTDAKTRPHRTPSKSVKKVRRK